MTGASVQFIEIDPDAAVKLDSRFTPLDQTQEYIGALLLRSQVCAIGSDSLVLPPRVVWRRPRRRIDEEGQSVPLDGPYPA